MDSTMFFNIDSITCLKAATGVDKTIDKHSLFRAKIKERSDMCLLFWMASTIVYRITNALEVFYFHFLFN